MMKMLQTLITTLGLYIRSIYDECYNLKNRKFEIGINKSAVLTPSSTIDGGTY